MVRRWGDIITIDMRLLAKDMPACSVSHVNESASVEPLPFWGIAGIALPLDGCRISTSCSVVYLPTRLVRRISTMVSV